MLDLSNPNQTNIMWYGINNDMAIWQENVLKMDLSSYFLLLVCIVYKDRVRHAMVSTANG